MKILLIEDDRTQAEYLTRGLREEGHLVEHVDDGKKGLMLSLDNEQDVIILDRMLPGLDGLSVLKALRASGNQTPVLMLTAMTTLQNKVEGLQTGADDYLAKPFAISELIARIEALHRRPPAVKTETRLTIADLEMNLISRKVTRSGQVIDLQPREYALLEALIQAKGRVLTRTMLLEKVWGFHFDPTTNVLETHVSRLRAKIDKPFSTQLIRTVRQVGYQLSAE